MPLDLDAETIVKIYTPIAMAAGAVWKWYQHRDRVKTLATKRDRDLHLARVDATLLKCELERKEDRKECAEKHEALQRRLDAMQEKHNKTQADAFERVADALEVMVNRRGASSGTHSAVNKEEKR